MKRQVVIAFLVLIAAAGIAGYAKLMPGSREAAEKTFAAKFYCPMHPTYTSDRAGTCPICGMNLVPIPQDHSKHGAAASSGVEGFTTVMLDKKEQGLLGIQTEPVAIRPIGEKLRIAGTVMIEKYAFMSGAGAWVYAPIDDIDGARIQINQWATVEIPVRERVLRGTVSFIDSDVTLHTKVIKIKLTVSNPETFLKTDMGANVILDFDNRNALTIPVAAAFRSGERIIAFVAGRDDGYEPRELKLGARSGDFYEVLSGVKEGERVVTSGNFLLDSQSRILAGLEAQTSKSKPGAAHAH